MLSQLALPSSMSKERLLSEVFPRCLFWEELLITNTPTKLLSVVLARISLLFEPVEPPTEIP